MNATCNNCGRQWQVEKLKSIDNLQQRVAPGEIVPTGECPECGALCHLEQPARTVIVNVYGGLVQAVYSDAKVVDVIVVDWDQEGVTEEDMERDEGLTIVNDRIVWAYPPTIHRLKAMDDELRQAVEHVDNIGHC